MKYPTPAPRRITPATEAHTIPTMSPVLKPERVVVGVIVVIVNVIVTVIVIVFVNVIVPAAWWRWRADGVCDCD